MKLFFSIFLLLFLNSNAQSQCVLNDFNSFLGKWVRIDLEEGKTGGETWELSADSSYKGFGYVKSETSYFSEKLELRCDSLGCYYIADVEHNDKAIQFKCLQCDSVWYLFVNQQHDFPKEIQNNFNGDTLNVEVRNEERSEKFVFMKSMK